jgi:diketogulonate reductase-like aldo/keto reductase
MQEPLIHDLAKKYNRTPGQIVLNWHIHLGHTVFPKMTQEKHLEENMKIFEFELNEEDYNKISKLNRNIHFYDRVPVENYNFIPLLF